MADTVDVNYDRSWCFCLRKTRNSLKQQTVTACYSDQHNRGAVDQRERQTVTFWKSFLQDRFKSLHCCLIEVGLLQLNRLGTTGMHVFQNVCSVC